MKKFFEQFLDFITGGFFNVIGAAARVLFSKKKYAVLLEEPLSNYIGMVVMTVLLIGVYLYIKFSI
jgi:hypothetical protein